MTVKEAVAQLYKARDAIDTLLEAYEKRDKGCTDRKPKKAVKKFVPPSMQEWISYGKTLDPPFDHLECGSAFEHYQANGWMVGKNKMKDWKAACRQCHTRWLKETPNAAAKSGNSLEALKARLKYFQSKHQGPHTSYWDFLSDQEREECRHIVYRIKELQNG